MFFSSFRYHQATLFGVMEAFEKANAYAPEEGKKPFYNIKLAGANVKQYVSSLLKKITH